VLAWLRRPDGERGAASLEAVIVFPALLIVIFAAMEIALWFYARNLALAAAQEGVRAGRAEHANIAAGTSAARRFIDRAAPDTLQGATISSAGSTATEVHIRVAGRSLSVLPGLPGLPVAQESRASVERFTTPGQP
jgi:Flp pilus assembly protein TadG